MRATVLILMAGVITFAACQKAEVGQPASAPEVAVQVSDDARLAAADAADGATDHVVSKCATCRLGMDGVPAHTVSYAGYELHFCSAECKEAFEKDPGAVIRNLPPKS
jgi:YHS domain-containing protein